MKMWILTAKFGQGHFSAAEALKEELNEYGHQVIISDIVELVHPKLSGTLYYIFKHAICRSSSIYNFINEFGRNPKKSYGYNNIMKREIEKMKPDIIITTWSGCVHMIGEVEPPVYVCITDVGVHSGWIHKGVKGYFVASRDVKQRLMKSGIEEERIFVQGIPVKKVFRDIERKNITTKKILVMGGGLGIIPWVGRLLKELQNQKDIKITVITGNNRRMYKKLKKKYKGIEVVGFTNEVHRYMSEADVLVSKPGGISLFEGIHTQTPFIAVFPRYKHEIENAEFILSKDIGEVIWEGQSIMDSLIDIIENEEKKKKYSTNLLKFKNEIDSLRDENQLWRYDDVI